jgi:hypothetical protein
MFFFLALFASALVSQPRFDLQGRVPSAITRDFLRSNFTRILTSISPSTAADTTPITLIYYSRNDKRKLGVRLPEWGGGGAIGSDTVIVPIDKAPLADMEVDRVTVHELVHIALERAYGRIRLPRWFHEGLAMTLSGELSFEEQIALSRAVFTQRLLPLDSIEKVNRFDAYGAALAYSQSHLAVGFMIDHYGMDGIPELLATVRATGSFDSAFTRVFGLTGPEFQRLVAQELNDRYRYLFLIGDTWLYWLPVALLVVFAYVAVRIRNKKKQQRMEEEEEGERAALAAFAAHQQSQDSDDDPDDEVELNEDGSEPDDDEEEEEEPEK